MFAPKRVSRPPSSLQSSNPKVINKRKSLAPQSKKVDKLTLESVLGLTVYNRSSLCYSPKQDLIAYTAGCVIVLLSPTKNRQSHIINRTKVAFSCLSFSHDGRFLASGETGTKSAKVRIWDVEEQSQVFECKEKFTNGVSCVTFSPDSKVVVGVGSEQDRHVRTWNWRVGQEISNNRESKKVKAISYAENGAYFVVVGHRLVKYWYLVQRSSSVQQTEVLVGKAAILGEDSNSLFCDVACGRGGKSSSTFVVTEKGKVIEFSSDRTLLQYIDLDFPTYCISVTCDHLFLGCGNGFVRVFNPHTLHYMAAIPKPHYLGVDVSSIHTVEDMLKHPTDARYPDVIAISVNSKENRVSVVYNDHSLYVWYFNEQHNKGKGGKSSWSFGKAWSALYHAQSVWGVEMYPDVSVPGLAASLPENSFLTCGNDEIAKEWTRKYAM